MKFIKPFLFTSIIFLFFILILHGFFVALCKINSIPNFRFDTFLDPNFKFDNENIEKEITQGDIQMYVPQTKLRQSVPDGLSVPFGGEKVTYYSGYRRTSPIQKEKAKDTKRVIMVGDSFTWGWKVSDINTVPNQLEILLNKNLDSETKKVEVLNAGMTASTITHSYEGVKDYDSHFNPDVVILTFSENDLADLREKNSINLFTYNFLKKFGKFGPIRFFVAGKYKKERLNLLKKMKELKNDEIVGNKIGVKKKITHIKWPTNIQDFLKNPPQKSDIQNLLTWFYFGNDGLISPYTKNDNVEALELWKEWEDTLYKFKILSEEKKFKLIVHTFPIFARLYEPQFDNFQTPENIISSICKKLNITNINPLIQFREADMRLRKEKKYLFMLPEDGHPSIEGNKLAAEILAEQIKPLLK